MLADGGRGFVEDVFTGVLIVLVVLEAGRVEVDDVLLDLFLGVMLPALGVGASLVGVDRC